MNGICVVEGCNRKTQVNITGQYSDMCFPCKNGGNMGIPAEHHPCNFCSKPIIKSRNYCYRCSAIMNMETNNPLIARGLIDEITFDVLADVNAKMIEDKEIRKTAKICALPECDNITPFGANGNAIKYCSDDCKKKASYIRRKTHWRCQLCNDLFKHTDSTICEKCNEKIKMGLKPVGGRFYHPKEE